MDRLSLNDIGWELVIEHGWQMPDGYNRREDTDSLNYTHAEHQQSKRAKCDSKELKRLFAECWQQFDIRTAFACALKEHGLILARGDRRGFVAVDAQGEVHAIARWVGVKTREVHARLGDLDGLPSVETALKQFDNGDHVQYSQSLQNLQSNTEYLNKPDVIKEKLRFLVSRHCEERNTLEECQEIRRIEEIKVRSEQLPTGLKAA